MTGLRPALVALLAWAVHFFGAYGLMLALPDAPVVGWLTIALGLACLVVLALLLRSTPRSPMVTVASILAGVAIAWQSLVGMF